MLYTSLENENVAVDNDDKLVLVALLKKLSETFISFQLEYYELTYNFFEEFFDLRKNFSNRSHLDRQVWCLGNLLMGVGSDSGLVKLVSPFFFELWDN